MNRTRESQVFFSDYDRRKQLMLHESESSLRARGKLLAGAFQRLALRSSPGRAALLLIAQPSVDHSSSYVEFKYDFCSDFPADSPMNNNQNHKIRIRWHIE